MKFRETGSWTNNFKKKYKSCQIKHYNFRKKKKNLKLHNKRDVYWYYSNMKYRRDDDYFNKIILHHKKYDLYQNGQYVY